MPDMLFGKRRWSSRKRVERLAIFAIGLVVFCAGTFGVLVIVFQTGTLVPRDPVAEQRQVVLQKSIERELHAGDPTEQIVTFFVRHTLAYEYDSINRRYVAAGYRSTNGAHYVMVTLWVDPNGRYVRGEAADILTSL